MAPALSVVVDSGHAELCKIVTDVHEKHTVVSCEAVIKLFQKLWGPASIFIAPSAYVLLTTMRVSDFDKLVACRRHVSTEESEGVTLNEARSTCCLVRAGW